MDSKKLEDKLTEVAEWVYPSLSLDNAIERITPSTGAREYKQAFIPNPQLGPRIVKYKDSACLNPCAWCGRVVNQVCSYRKIIVKDKPVGWHCECHTCRKIYDPKTGQLTHFNSKKAKESKEKAKKIAWYNDPNYKG